MCDTCRVLQSERPGSLGKLCAEHKVNVADVWLPLQLCRTTRGKDDTPVHVPPNVPVVLFNHATSQLVTRRCDILSQIPLLFVDEPTFAIPPSAVPPGCTVFVRATQAMSKKRVPQGTALLHRPIGDAKAVEEGSALMEDGPLQPLKCPQASKVSVLDASTVAGGADVDLERRKKRTRNDAAFEHHLRDALVQVRAGQNTRENVIMKETMANLMRVCDAAPLHFVTRGKMQAMLQVRGMSWNLPDRRVMYRVFRNGNGVTDLGSKSTYADSTRLILVFMIDDVLLKREPVGAHLQHGTQTWSVIDPDLPSAAHSLAEKGYRIVLLDHYPSLHHGNAFALEEKLHPIAELCNKYFTCNVTVVLSTMSYISASHRRDGMSFVLPNSGVWQFFITHLNGGLRADADSLLVGAASAPEDDRQDASNQYQRHMQFAMNCGLCYVDGPALKRKALQT